MSWAVLDLNEALPTLITCAQRTVTPRSRGPQRLSAGRADWVDPVRASLFAAPRDDRRAWWPSDFGDPDATDGVAFPADRVPPSGSKTARWDQGGRGALVGQFCALSVRHAVDGTGWTRHAGLVGRLRERQRELAAVEVLLERRGRMLLLEGRSGIGKTSLVEAACAPIAAPPGFCTPKWPRRGRWPHI